jgi:hypothetical protein
MMEHWVIMAAVAAAYVAMFGLGYRINSQLGKVWEAMNKHHQDGDIHREAKDFVPSQVCDARFTQLLTSQAELKKDMNRGFDKLEALIKNGNSN